MEHALANIKAGDKVMWVRGNGPGATTKKVVEVTRRTPARIYAAGHAFNLNDPWSPSSAPQYGGDKPYAFSYLMPLTTPAGRPL